MQNRSDNVHQLRSLLNRTIQVLSDETALLRDDPGANVAELAERKNRCLFELNLVLRDRPPVQLVESLKPEFALLQEKSAENEYALSVAMTAANDMVGILGAALEEDQSDGTYPVANQYSVNA